MALDASAPKRRSLSMTSLIDVIFLLLLFFMLSSTFSRFAEIPLTGAAAGSGGAVQTTYLIFLRLGAEDLLIQGRTTALDGVPEALLTETAGPRQALVSLSGDVTAQRLTDLLVALARVPELSVKVLQ